MGWLDCHLHAFRLKKPHGRKIHEIRIPSDDFDDIKILPGWDVYIADYFSEPGKTAEYEYDFGDSWYHEILFESQLLKDQTTKYPVCFAGERVSPPEDCGGVRGYDKLLDILQVPQHEQYNSMIEWLNGWYGTYDPEKFEKEKSLFSPLKS